MFSAEEEAYLVVPDIEPVKAFLTNALNLQITGDKAQYELIVHQLRTRDDPDTLWKVLVGLCHFSYTLTKQAEEFRRLLNCIFGYDWKCEAKVTVAMVNLINHLVATNSTFLGRAFQLYVKSLLPSMTTSLSTEQVEDNIAERRDLIHRALRSILIQVPTGRSVLYPILCEHFPHKRFSRAVQTEYTAQLLQMCQYEPMLQAKVLELIIMKCLEMDVEIVIEDSGDVRIDEQALDGEDPDFDDLDFDGLNNNRTSRGVGHAQQKGAAKRKQLTDSAPTRIPAEVAEMADKLDSMLLLVVQFCEQQIGDTGASAQATVGAPPTTAAVPSAAHTPRTKSNAASSGSRDRVLQQLLAIFESTIMSIHKSKFVQFVVFFAASLHPPFAQAVAERLLAITLDERAAGTQRQSAVMYLASYLSRSTFLSAEFISDILSRLLNFAAAYATRAGGNNITNLTPVTSTGSLRASTSGTSISAYTSREPSTDASTLSPGRRTSPAAMGHNSIYAAENVEFDEFGRAFVREVTVSRHELFYSVVQAACYTLCFYGVSMAARQRDDEAVRRCWETVVSCKFDPLRYCLKTVRVEFIRLAAAVGLFSAHCWDNMPADLLYTEILQQQQVQHQQQQQAGRSSDNATMTTSTTNEATSYRSSQHQRSHGIVQSQGVVMSSGSQREVRSANALDSFFPFDPCLLCKLHQTIQKAYRVWDGVPGLDDVPEEDTYEGEEDEYDDQLSEDDLEGGSGIASEDRVKLRTANVSSHAIPMRRHGSGRRSEAMAQTPGSQMSGTSAMDAFATSSLSSVVSSIAYTDTAMSVASSSAVGMAHSPFVGSYLKAAQAHLHRDSVGSDPRSASKSSAAAAALKSHQQQQQQDQGESDSDEGDSGMHDAHMTNPSAGYGTGGSAEKFDANFRRPRFYSVGSTGSW